MQLDLKISDYSFRVFSKHQANRNQPGEIEDHAGEYLLYRIFVKYTGKKGNKIMISNKNNDLVCGHGDTLFFLPRCSIPSHH